MAKNFGTRQSAYLPFTIERGDLLDDIEGTIAVHRKDRAVVTVEGREDKSTFPVVVSVGDWEVGGSATIEVSATTAESIEAIVFGDQVLTFGDWTDNPAGAGKIRVADGGKVLVPTEDGARTWGVNLKPTLTVGASKRNSAAYLLTLRATIPASKSEGAKVGGPAPL